MDRIAEAVVTFVINAAWQSTVIALIGIGAARLLRRAPARSRFPLLALTLIAAVAAPAMTLIPRSAPSTTRVRSTSAGTVETIAIQREPVSAMRPSLNLRSAEIVAVLYVIGLLLAAARRIDVRQCR